MNSDIQYLQLLEDDLREAAQFERELDEEDRAVDAQGRKRATIAPRRLPRRGSRWSSVAAVLVAFVVVAGGIGFLAQQGSKSSDRSNSLSLQHGSAGLPATAPSEGQQGAVAGPVTRGSLGQSVSDAGLHAFDLTPALHYGAYASGSGSGQGPAPIAGSSNGGSGQGAVNGSGLSAPGPTGDLSKIERDGDIGIQMDNGQFTNGANQITKIAHDNKGTVLSSTSEGDRSGTFTLRIPVAHFDHVMSQLRTMAPVGGILYQDSTGKDVTANFIDYRARLSILKSQRDLLIGLQSKVTDAGQILFYADKINAVQLNIETIQGDLNFLNDSVAQSTIKVELREKDAPEGTAATSSSTIAKPSLGSAWNFSVQGFLRVLGAVVIGLGYLIPLSIIALLAWGVVMLARRRRPATSSTP